MESYSFQGIKELFGGKYQIYPGTVKENIRGVSGLLGSYQRPIAQIPLSHPNSNSKFQNSNVKTLNCPQ
jgi:hypothetical protein